MEYKGSVCKVWCGLVEAFLKYASLNVHMSSIRPSGWSPTLSARGTYRILCILSVIMHLLHARLGYQHFSILFFVVVALGVKVRSISCNIGPAERAISRNMDRSRMSGIGKSHDDGHVPCNNI